MAAKADDCTECTGQTKIANNGKKKEKLETWTPIKYKLGTRAATNPLHSIRPL